MPIRCIYSLLLLLLIGAGSGLSTAAFASESPDRDFLRVSHDCTSLDPRKSVVATCNNLMYQLFDNLVAVDESGKLVPGLAKAWVLDPQNKTITFTLRQDRRWSDGQPVSAQDLILSWSSIISEQIPHPQLNSLLSIKGAESLAKSRKGLLSGLSAPNPYTLRVEFTRFDPLFHYRTVNGYLAPIPAHIYQAVGENWVQPEHIVFSGWYQAALSPDESYYQLSPNPHHPDQASLAIQTIKLNTRQQRDVRAQLQADNALDINTLFQDPSEAVQSILKVYNKKIVEFPTARTRGLLVNARRLDESLLPVIKCAIDTKEFVSRVADVRTGVAASRWVTLPSVELPDIRRRPLDCPALKRMQQQQPVTEVVISVRTSFRESQIRVLRAMLAPYNIRLSPHIDRKPFKELSKSLTEGDYQLIELHWYVALPDPSGFFVILQYARDWLPEGVKKPLLALQSQALEQQGSERLSTFAKAEQLMLDQAGLIPLNHPRRLLTVRADLCGLTVSQSGIIPYRYLHWCR